MSSRNPILEFAAQEEAQAAAPRTNPILEFAAQEEAGARENPILEFAKRDKSITQRLSEMPGDIVKNALATGIKYKQNDYNEYIRQKKSLAKKIATAEALATPEDQARINEIKRKYPEAGLGINTELVKQFWGKGSIGTEQPDDALAERNKAALGRELSPGAQKANAFLGGVTGGISTVLGAPFRFGGGVAKGLQEESAKMAGGQVSPEVQAKMQEAAQNLKAGKPGEVVPNLLQAGAAAAAPVAKRAWRSLTEEEPVYASDVYRDAFKALGATPDEAERWSGPAGLFTELAMPMGGRPVVFRDELARQFAKVGVKDAGKAASYISQIEELPKQLAASRRLVRAVAGPEAEAKFLKLVGGEGEAMGRTAARTFFTPRSKFNQMAFKEGRVLPPGATSATPTAIREVAEQVQMGAGQPRGVLELQRQAQGAGAAVKNAIPRVQARLKEGLGARSAEAGNIMDLQSELAALKAAPAGSEEAAARAKAFPKQLERASEKMEKPLTVEDVEAGFKPTEGEYVYPFSFPPEFGPGPTMASRVPVGGIERKTLGEYEQLTKDLHALSLKNDVDVGMREFYVPRSMTKEERALIPMSNRGETTASGAPAAYTKGRTVGSTLAGTRGPMEERIAPMMHAEGTMIAGAQAEAKILPAYARPMPKEWLTPDGKISTFGKQEMARQGLAEYEPKLNMRLKGQRFVVDQGTFKVLDRMTNPDVVSKSFSKIERMVHVVEPVVNKIMAPWKAWATVFRPGFVARNMISNSYTYWLADGAIDQLPKAAQIVMQRARRKGMDLGAGSEIERLAEQNKVFGSGFHATELAGSAGKASINPLSARFAHQPAMQALNSGIEETYRLALFMDGLKKGMTPSEAASRVAKYFFNYDEISTFARGMRMAMPFFTWPYKNWGQQIANVFERPGKLAKSYETVRSAISMDPLSQEERRQFETIPGHGEKGIVPMPFYRGPKGERGYTTLGGVMPFMAIEQLASPVQTAKEMSNPIPGLLFGGETSEVGTGGAPYGSMPSPPTSMRYVDHGTQTILDTMRHNSRPMYDMVTNLFGIVPVTDDITYQKEIGRLTSSGVPAKEAIAQAEQTKPVLGYKWSSKVPDTIGKLFPHVGTIMRALRAEPEKYYDTVKRIIAGITVMDMTPDRAMDYANAQLKQALDEMNQFKYVKRATGTLLEPGSRK